jgi:hypothetical protein
MQIGGQVYKMKMLKINMEKRWMIGLVMGIVLVGIVVLIGRVGAWSDEGTLFQNVTDCGTLNTTNAVYTLQNPVNSTVTCFSITANNVTLDCQNWGIRLYMATCLQNSLIMAFIQTRIIFMLKIVKLLLWKLHLQATLIMVFILRIINMGTFIT